MLKIYDLTTEYRANPIGLDTLAPRFGWKLKSDRRGVKQTSYRIAAQDEVGRLLWDSGLVDSAQSFAVVWQGDALSSFKRVYWHVEVTVTDECGLQEQAQSVAAWFEMGLMVKSLWRGVWIEPEDEVEIDGRMPAPYLRREFDVRQGLKSARIYQSAHGLYEGWFNGRQGTDEKFKPGFTAYYQRLQYQAHDITPLLHEGRNCWAVMLGDGWWRGNTGGTFRNNFGYKLAYLGQLRLEYADGSIEWVSTDEAFKASVGGLLKCDMKEGETFDAGLEPHGWKEPGFDDRAWKNVHRESDAHAGYDNLVASLSVPVREKEQLVPVVLHTPDGNTVLDFGQNIAGYVKMRLHGLPRGQSVVLMHGEALDENGNFTQKNIILENPDAEIQKITYITRGDAEEQYQPSFAIFGFRYVKVMGLDSVNSADFMAVAVYSDMGETGDFHCSNALVNQLVSNSRWSQKGNFMDVPTDCPTRERSPWTGDAQVYARTAAQFMNVYPFFERWLTDLSLEQFPSGKVPNTVPISASVHNPEELARKKHKMESLPDGSIIKLALQMTLGTPDNGGEIEGSAGWGDAAVIIPYTMYLCYGDQQILKNQYASAKRWVDYEIREAAKKSEVYRDMPWYAPESGDDGSHVWDVDFHFGEWCEPGGADGDTGKTMELYRNPDYKTASMYLFYSARLLAEIAALLDYREDAAYYGAYATRVKEVYNRYFIPEDGVIVEGRQAPNVRALFFGLASDEKKPAVAAALGRMIRENNWQLNTGFLSTPYLLPVLAENGMIDEAFHVLEQENCPGWLYNVKCGATTILENWDGYARCRNSFNHYSYGAVCDFLFEYVAGIRLLPDHPGYREFALQPLIGGTLTEASAIRETPMGEIRASWKKGENGEISYAFTVPAGSMAHVFLPDGRKMAIGSGKYTFTTEEGCK